MFTSYNGVKRPNLAKATSIPSPHGHSSHPNFEVFFHHLNIPLEFRPHCLNFAI